MPAAAEPAVSVEHAADALKAYVGRGRTKPPRVTDAEDLLCDLLHWIEAHHGSVSEALMNAERNWQDERSAR